MTTGTEVEFPAPDDWLVRRDGVDEARFTEGVIGPYRLGRRLRISPFGEVRLGIHSQWEFVVEIELLARVARTSFSGPDSRIMADLAQVVGLRHRHLGPLVGCGFDEGTPYVVRPHRLGRTLEEVVERGRLSHEAAIAALFAVADAVQFLAEQGPTHGACAMGGFGAEDVFLGFDGTVSLLGLGLKALRCPVGDDPVARDLAAVLGLAQRLESWVAEPLSLLSAGARDARAIVRALRHAHREICQERRPHVAILLRQLYSEVILDERADFGLDTLH